MCIIAIKPAGIDMPDDELITNMWINNPDGAGFMYAYKGRVYIEKGFMTKAHLDERLSDVGRSVDLKSAPVVLHFRITTHGGTKPENCHPFPITDNMAVLSKCKWVTDVGVAHNGIIPIRPRSSEVSDTMEYIVSQLSCLKSANRKFYKSRNLMRLIENAINSRMVFLSEDGGIYTIGQFVEHDGMLYSNTSYEPRIHYSSLYDRDWSVYSGKDKRRNTSTVRSLVFVADMGTDACVRDKESGDIVDTDTYAIDRKGRLYLVDGNTGCAYRDKYSSVIGPVRWSADLAQNIKCYASLDDYAREWYGDYGEPW